MKTALAVLALAAAGCSSVRVSTDWDRSADFTSMHTFAWMERTEGEPDPLAGDPLVGKRVTAAVERELTAKGLTRSAGSADVLVALHARTRERLEITTWPSWGYGWGHHGYWGPWGPDRVEVSQWTEGSLVVDLVKADTQELVWRGIASAAIDADSRSPERIDEAMQKLFAEFPPAQQAR